MPRGDQGPQRQCLALAYYHGLSHSELAAHLGEPIGSVKVWLRRGLEKLKRCLDARDELRPPGAPRSPRGRVRVRHADRAGAAPIRAVARTLPAADVAAREWEARTDAAGGPGAAGRAVAASVEAIDRRTGGAAPRRDRASWWLVAEPALALAFGVIATMGLVRLYPDAIVPLDEIVQERVALPQSYVGLLTDRERRADGPRELDAPRAARCRSRY